MDQLTRVEDKVDNIIEKLSTNRELAIKENAKISERVGRLEEKNKSEKVSWGRIVGLGSLSITVLGLFIDRMIK